MRPFAELTTRGKLGRARRVALAALEHYDLSVRKMQAVTYHLNFLYRIDTTDGERYALRISHWDWRDDVELWSELTWLTALANETDIGVHRPLPNRSGDLITTVAVDGFPERQRVVLFTWTPGVQLAERLTDENVEQMGVLSARLHEHGAAFTPPPGFTTRRLNRLFPRGETNVIFDTQFTHLFTPERSEVFEAGIERGQAELDRLYASPSPPQVVHGDLHHENVLVHRGKLQPVDFEDIINAYPIQDIGLTFYDFRYHTDPTQHDYAALCAAFQRGYTTRLAWPQEYANQIDILHLVRRVWIVNWVLRRQPAEVHLAFIETETERFRQLMSTE